MTKILCVGDLHLSHTRLALCSSVLDWIASVIVEKQPDAVAYLGDVFDTHAVIRSECLGIWTHHLQHTLNYCPTYWICGNHEFFKPIDSTYNALIPFSTWNHKHLHTIVEPAIIDELGFIPYLPNTKDWDTVANSLKSNILFTHNTFAGADMGHIVARDGILPSSSVDRLVISGHIHKRQQLDLGTTQVVYPGTPYSWSANDVDMVKGVMIIDTKNYRQEFVESPLPLWRRMEIDLRNPTPDLPGDISKDHMVARITGTRSAVRSFMESGYMEELKLKYASVSVSTNFLDSAKSQSGAKSIKIDSIRSSIDSYMETAYSGTAPADAVKDMILNALEESP